VRIDNEEDRSQIADYWLDRCEKIEARLRTRPRSVGKSGMEAYQKMQKFVLDTPDMLAAIANEIAETDLDRFLVTALTDD
jgi:hypothetical protein